MTLSLLSKESGIKDLVFFLGCLPGGISKDWLKKMWDGQKLDADLPILTDLDLVILDEEN